MEDGSQRAGPWESTGLLLLSSLPKYKLEAMAQYPNSKLNGEEVRGGRTCWCLPGRISFLRPSISRHGQICFPTCLRRFILSEVYKYTRTFRFCVGRTSLLDNIRCNKSADKSIFPLRICIVSALVVPKEVPTAPLPRYLQDISVERAQISCLIDNPHPDWHTGAGWLRSFRLYLLGRLVFSPENWTLTLEVTVRLY